MRYPDAHSLYTVPYSGQFFGVRTTSAREKTCFYLHLSLRRAVQLCSDFSLVGTSLIQTNKKDDIPCTEEMIYLGSYVAGQSLLKGMHMSHNKYVKQVKLWQLSSA